tara:strand:- start:292 stop:612 length:321 start_codon:yes stop_codon:yes gene_type:complete
MDKTWKKFERWVASFLTDIGDESARVPVSGRSRGDSPDVTSDVLSIECKYRKVIPHWIKNAMSQAVASSRDNKTPVVFLKESGSNYNDTLIIFRAIDFKKAIEDER